MKHTDRIDDTILIKDWCQALNPGTAPAALTREGHVLVRWKCHKCGRIWDAKVKNRFNGGGCTCDAIARKTALCAGRSWKSTAPTAPSGGSAARDSANTQIAVERGISQSNQ